MPEFILPHVKAERDAKPKPKKEKKIKEKIKKAKRRK